MILTCPQCESQFELDSALLGSDGKRVRCSSCSHDWFQLPDPEEQAEDAALDVPEASPESAEAEAPAEESGATAEEVPVDEEIPDGVKPKTGKDSAKEAAAPKGLLAHFKNSNNQIGYGAALLLFLVIMILLVLFSSGISKAWPPMKGFYNAIGIHVPSAGDGLSFEGIAAAYSSDGHVKIVGEILNLKSNETAIPPLKASMIVEGQALPIEWRIDALAATIEAEGKLRFKSSHAYDGEHRPKSVTVGFDLLGEDTAAHDAAVKTGVHDETHGDSHH